MGKRNDKQVEVLGGLAEGDQILLEKPKDKRIDGLDDRLPQPRPILADPAIAAVWLLSSAFCLCLCRAAAGGRAARSRPPRSAVPLRSARSRSRCPRRRPTRVDAAIQRGVAFLLKRQNANGSWGSERSSRPDEVYAPVPGAHLAFRAAVTALCISALLEVGGDGPEVARAVDRGEAWLFDHLKSVRRDSPDCIYNNWTHAYSIQALVRMLHRRPADPERCRKIRELIEQQIGMLGRYECVDGGWCLLRLRVSHAAAQRLDDQLRHGHGLGGAGRGAATRALPCRSGWWIGPWPRSSVSASPISATITASI